MDENEIDDIFVQGAISPALIARCITCCASQTQVGGHSIFLGQVRGDEIGSEKVSAILYSAYQELALELLSVIKDEIFSKYSLYAMQIHQSLGTVYSGEICLFVSVCSAHRAPAIEACRETVERIKAELPVWGKEIFMTGGYQWKENH